LGGTFRAEVDEQSACWDSVVLDAWPFCCVRAKRFKSSFVADIVKSTEYLGESLVNQYRVKRGSGGNRFQVELNKDL